MRSSARRTSTLVDRRGRPEHLPEHAKATCRDRRRRDGFHRGGHGRTAQFTSECCRLRPVHLEERRDRRRRLRAGHRLQPDRAEPGVRPDRHRRRLPLERGHASAGCRCSTGSASTNWGHNGVVSLATDPVDPNKVYVAAGMYTNSWDPNNGAILRSADQGATWQTVAAAVQARRQHAGPGHGRAARRSTPTSNSILYLGAPSGNGLWRSTDSGVTWAQVTSFPNAGNYVAGPERPQRLHRRQPGRRLGHVRPAQRHAAGIADADDLRRRRRQAEHRLPHPPTAGRPGQRVAGQPTGYIAAQGRPRHRRRLPLPGHERHRRPVRRRQGRRLAATTPRPAPGRRSARSRPVQRDDYFGYSGLTIDRQHPDTIMVATQISWWPDVIFFRSTDGGATWTRDLGLRPATRTAASATRMDITAAPWLTFGTQPGAARGHARSWAG